MLSMAWVSTDVDAVAGPDQAGSAADRIDGDADRAHARFKHGGEEAAIPWPQNTVAMNRCPGCQIVTDHSA